MGKPGGSGASIYMAHEGKDFGRPAVRYAQTLADEILTGSRASARFCRQIAAP